MAIDLICNMQAIYLQATKIAQSWEGKTVTAVEPARKIRMSQNRMALLIFYI